MCERPVGAVGAREEVRLEAQRAEAEHPAKEVRAVPRDDERSNEWVRKVQDGVDHVLCRRHFQPGDVGRCVPYEERGGGDKCGRETEERPARSRRRHRSVLVHDLLLGAVFVHASHARSRSAPAHRPRLSSRSAPKTILVRPKSTATLMRPRLLSATLGRMSGRRIPQSSRLGDLALAIGLALLALAEIWWPGGFVATGPIEGSRAVLVPTALAMTLPLALRRRWPLATVLV